MDNRLKQLVMAVSVVLAVIASSCAAQPSVEWTTFPPPLEPAQVAPTSPRLAGPLRIEGSDLVDSTGRQVVLRGTNLVRKSEPFWVPFSSDSTADGWPEVFDGDDFHYLNEMGYNAVRLGVWYSEIVPEVGVIDLEYLDAVDEMVSELEANGIYVLLDFHQDVFHGMPEWATSADAALLSGEPPAFLESIGWAAAYLSERSLRQWKDLLANAETSTPGVTMWEALGAGTAAVAERFEGRSNIAGIELLNEPFPGIDYVRCIVSGCVDVERRLRAGYEIVTAAVRDVAPTIPLWQEPVISAPHYGDTNMAPPSDPQTGFAWHAYCHGTDGGKLEPVAPLEQERCRAMMGTAHTRAGVRSRAWDSPSLMTEFGASVNPLDAILVTGEADKRVGSWFYWAYEYGNSPEIDSVLARVYPQATAGEPGRLAFDPSSGTATYGYEAGSDPSAATVLAIPPQHYPSGYEVSVVDGVVTSAPNAAHLTVVGTPGALVRIRVTRRA